MVQPSTTPSSVRLTSPTLTNDNPPLNLPWHRPPTSPAFQRIPILSFLSSHSKKNNYNILHPAPHPSTLQQRPNPLLSRLSQHLLRYSLATLTAHRPLFLSVDAANARVTTFHSPEVFLLTFEPLVPQDHHSVTVRGAAAALALPIRPRVRILCSPCTTDTYLPRLSHHNTLDKLPPLSKARETHTLVRLLETCKGPCHFHDFTLLPILTMVPLPRRHLPHSAQPLRLTVN